MDAFSNNEDQWVMMFVMVWMINDLGGNGGDGYAGKDDGCGSIVCKWDGNDYDIERDDNSYNTN